jgi:endonuclease/exonuclease/phosphatase family metal-dependent hydrolase
MKLPYALLTVVCLVASVPLAIGLLNRTSAQRVPVVRFATFNAALNRALPDELLAELRGGGSEPARRIAEIVQRCDVDVLLLCELDRDAAAATAAVFRDEYLAKGQNGQRGIRFEFLWAGPVNTGEPSGLDLDGDGATGGPADAFGYGRFPGQYGMALFSRHPIDEANVRSFQKLQWSAMPGAMQPEAFWPETTWRQLRLSSKSHWDVPVRMLGRVVHVLCSHPTPPAFDGPEDRNGCRNHDEIRFWVDYLTPGKADWIVDDAGRAGGLAEAEPFVLMGDLNCDPADGDARRGALLQLLAHPRVQDALPRSSGGEEQSKKQWGSNAGHNGEAALDTADFDDEQGPGNLRVDYVLPSRNLRAVESGVFWPRAFEPGAALVTASDHRLVFVDVAAP